MGESRVLGTVHFSCSVSWQIYFRQIITSLDLVTYQVSQRVFTEIKNSEIVSEKNVTVDFSESVMLTNNYLEHFQVAD